MNKTELLFEDLAKAVRRLQNALKEKSKNELVQAGSIQYFEFCFELAWKTIKVIVQSEGLHDCYSPKSCLKTAFKNQWIEDETPWLKMLDDRNIMSHSYDSEEALKVYNHLPLYLKEFIVLLKNLKPLLKK